MRSLLCALLVATASGLQLASLRATAPTHARISALRLAEDELSTEQITQAAEAASAPQAWPEQKAPVPGNEPVMSKEERENDGFDPRIVVYVSIPALVLVGQLFFTFSRDALGEVALGPAVMDLMIPPGL